VLDAAIGVMGQAAGAGRRAASSMLSAAIAKFARRCESHEEGNSNRCRPAGDVLHHCDRSGVSDSPAACEVLARASVSNRHTLPQHCRLQIFLDCTIDYSTPVDVDTILPVAKALELQASGLLCAPRKNGAP